MRVQGFGESAARLHMIASPTLLGHRFPQALFCASIAITISIGISVFIVHDDYDDYDSCYCSALLAGIFLHRCMRLPKHDQLFWSSPLGLIKGHGMLQ